MKNRILSLTAVVLASSALQTAAAQLMPGWKRVVVPAEGFRWEFDTWYEVGQFVNGDWWVHAPDGITLTDITPMTSSSPVMGGTWWRDGTHIDPVASSPVQGLDSTMYQKINGGAVGVDFDLSANIAEVVSTTGSYTTIDPDDHGGILSIITARSKTTAGGDPQIDQVEILTVVSTVPPSNAFRPPYTIHGPSQTHQPFYLTTADVDYARVEVVDANGDRLASSTIQNLQPLSTFEERVDGVWYEAAGGIPYLKRYGRPSVHMPSYGADVADHWVGAAFRTLLDDPTITLEDKKPLINDLIQIGWDRYSMAEQDRYDPAQGGFSYTGHWDETAGQGCGAKMSILYFAWLTDFPLGTANMVASTALDGPSASSGQWFQLDNQCFYVDTAAAPLGCGYGSCSGCTPNGTPEWGVAHFLDIEQGRVPTQDQYQWGILSPNTNPNNCSINANPAGCPAPPGYAAYRISDTARAWWLQVLMSRIIADNLALTQSKPSTWQSGYPFPKVVYDYMDRYYTTMSTTWCHTPGSNYLFAHDFNDRMHRDAWLAWGLGTTYFGRP